MILTPDRVFRAGEATWPPAATLVVNGWTIRMGLGGGRRVSAATPSHPPNASEAFPDPAVAEQAMRALGQTPLVMVPDGQDGLDAVLAARGYKLKDPVVALAAPVPDLARQHPPPVTTFEVWPPLAIQAEIWAAGGIGPARTAIMDRVTGPRTTILGRLCDRPAGCAFVACDGDVAVMHALEVAPSFRRGGLGRFMLAAAAGWAVRQGAAWLAVFVTRDNAAARALYTSAGLVPVAGYHYRILTG